MGMAKFISYRRVSTIEQGDSKLGLEAQQHAVEQFAAKVGGSIIRDYVEIASGDDDSRPILAAALKQAKRAGAVLLVAKLDRISRAVAVVSTLMREGVRFVAADRPDASTLELHILAVFAQEERAKIISRTVDALAAARRRGVKLGSARPGHWDGREDRRALGSAKGLAKIAAERRAERAEVFTAALPIAKKLEAAGASLRAIAAELNAQEISTSRGTKWHAAQVSRMLATA